MSSFQKKQKFLGEKFSRRTKAKSKNSISETSSVIGQTVSPDFVPSVSNQERTIILGSDLGIQVLYPRLSRMLGESGAVIIGVKNGHIFVSESSGYLRLDDSALLATKEAINSGLLAQQLVIRQDFQIRFVFRLKKSENSKEQGRV